MDAVLLARLQFAFTAGFHYIFPPLTIGMGWLIFYMKVRYLQTKDEVYADMSRFWIRVFALSFAIGVATGITMEFEFGTNWANYSRYVGDIFGAPLAAEGILAFFLESSFLGLLLFGEKRISPRLHVIASFFVAFGATLSAFWIIVANSWQQTPAGYEIVGGRAELTSFWEALFNPSTIPRYTHTVGGALVTGAFFMAGFAALYLLRKQHIEFAKKTLTIAVVAGFLASGIQCLTGHAHAVQVANTQPEKLAAFEGLFETQQNAPLLLFGIPNAETRSVDYEIALPGFLSMLAGNSFDTEVQGLNDFPRDEWPPLLLSFIPFHIMFVLGVGFVFFTAIGIFLIWRKKLFDTDYFLTKWYLRFTIIAVPFPFIANELGWLAAEAGRQPWVVYRVLRTEDAISVTVPAEQILFSLIMFVLIYALLFGLWIFLLKRKFQAGPYAAEKEEVAS